MLKDSGLQGKSVLVTGGSRGIGRAIVELFCAEGSRVTFFYLQDHKAAEETAAACRGCGGEVAREAVDVRDPKGTAAAVERVAEKSGGIDVLVNNCGIIRDNLLPLLEDDDLRAVFDTNVLGIFHVARAAVPYMMARRSGKIINLSSVSGEKGGRGQTNYAASKGAVNGLTRALAAELAPRGILVNAVAPGVIETEMSRDVRERAEDQIKSRILLRRVGTPLDVAHAVLFLASRYADYITGEILHVDGGFKME